VGANLKGVDVPAGSDDLRRALVTGKVEDLERPARCASGPAWARDTQPAGEWVGRIVLGAELAHTLRAKLGDCISVLVPFAGDKPEAEPAAYRFQVVGTFRLGFHEYDTRLAYTGLTDARHIAGARLTLFGVELRFERAERALQVEPEVVARLGYEPRIVDWQTLNHNLFRALLMQKLIIALFLMIIIIVAAFNIIASLTMIVLSKVREMAILSAMGARKSGILRLFLVAGSLVGFVGVGLGLVYGLAVCGLASLYGYPLDPKVYLIAELPVQISVGEVLFVAAATQLICVLATIYPALRASRLRVVEGLRYV
jgi:lipoprotein-releasing system permease protein